MIASRTQNRGQLDIKESAMLEKISHRGVKVIRTKNGYECTGCFHKFNHAVDAIIHKCDNKPQIWVRNSNGLHKNSNAGLSKIDDQ